MDDGGKDKNVHHLRVDDPVELNQVVAYLPRAVADGLVLALDEAGEAYRYDADSQRANYLQREGASLNVWSWHHVQAGAEFGDPVSLTARLDGPLDLAQARQVYLGATRRSAGPP